MRVTAVFLVYTAAIAGAELIGALADPLGAIILHLGILAALIFHSALTREPGWSGLLLALGLAPLMRIASLAMPEGNLSVTYRYLVISVPLLAGVIGVAGVSGLSRRDIGITSSAILWQVAVAVCGIAIGLTGYLALRPEPLIEALTWREALGPALILLVVTGFGEELIFRGVIQGRAEALTRWGWVYAAVLSSTLLIVYGSALHWFLGLLVALCFGWVVKRTGSVIGVGLSRGLINIGMYLVFPFVL